MDESEKKWVRSLLLSTPEVFVDPARAYRVRARVHIPGTHRVYLSSYGRGGDKQQMKEPSGRVWSWSLGIHGPIDGFTDFETTIGPDGDAAFLDGTLVLHGVNCRVYDGAPPSSTSRASRLKSCQSNRERRAVK
jgi:hypothetical protein